MSLALWHQPDFIELQDGVFVALHPHLCQGPISKLLLVSQASISFPAVPFHSSWFHQPS